MLNTIKAKVEVSFMKMKAGYYMLTDEGVKMKYNTAKAEIKGILKERDKKLDNLYKQYKAECQKAINLAKDRVNFERVKFVSYASDVYNAYLAKMEFDKNPKSQEGY